MYAAGFSNLMATETVAVRARLLSASRAGKSFKAPGAASMPRLALFNLVVGFSLVFFAACSGAFLALSTTRAFIQDPRELSSWSHTLLVSAHGHTSLFGILHCLFGLSLPYSSLPLRLKKMQSAGLFAGAVAMSLMLIYRAASLPQPGFEIPGAITGTLLSAALVALGSHAVGLAIKLWHPGY